MYIKKYFSLIIILLIVLIVSYTTFKSEVKANNELDINSVIIQGYQGFSGYDDQSFDKTYEVNVKGGIYQGQYNRQRKSIILRHDVFAKGNLFGAYEGFLEVDKDGKDKKFKVDEKHNFIPKNFFYTYDQYVIAISYNEEIGIFDLEEEKFKLKEKINGECSHVVGYKDIAYVNCVEGDNKSTIYQLDLNTLTYNSFQNLEGFNVKGMVVNESDDLFIATVNDSSYQLIQVKKDSIKQLMNKREEGNIVIEKLVISNDTVYALENKDNFYSLSAYDIDNQKLRQTELKDKEIGLDLMFNEGVGYVLIRSRDDRSLKIKVVNQNLNTVNSFEIKSNIVPTSILKIK